MFEEEIEIPLSEGDEDIKSIVYDVKNRAGLTTTEPNNINESSFEKEVNKEYINIKGEDLK